MIPSTHAIDSLIDPAEVAYRNQRRLARRRQTLVFGVVAILAISFLTWRVAKHLSAAWWLQANRYDVDWVIDKGNWTQGGSTTVHYSSRYSYGIKDDRPIFNLKFLKDLSGLEELDLATLPGIRDADLADIGDLTRLRRLSLDRTRRSTFGNVDHGELTDATLARIGRLTRLEELNLGDQRITDAGLEYLANLDQLRTLDLEGANITDTGLDHLKFLRSLKSLDLTGTQVTAEGVAAFEASRPGVKVVAEPPSTIPSSKTPR